MKLTPPSLSAYVADEKNSSDDSEALQDTPKNQKLALNKVDFIKVVS